MKDDEPPALCSVPIILGVDVEVFGLLNKNGTGWPCATAGDDDDRPWDLGGIYGVFLFIFTVAVPFSTTS
jgi:hypothetical protein